MKILNQSLAFLTEARNLFLIEVSGVLWLSGYLLMLENGGVDPYNNPQMIAHITPQNHSRTPPNKFRLRFGV